ncbi:3-oxoacyl-[acyl-carrier-protein] synthase 1 (3-oxoacyl-[acyl-carrier-protein] synthase I) (Beta-ketoacyl-ACP synthase I) (KAS I), partial [Durusdinium trenchii]
DAGLKPEDYENNERCASILGACVAQGWILGQGGTSIPDVMESCGYVADQVKRWPSKVGPYRVTRTMGSTVSAVLSSAFKLQGPSFSISSACSTGAHCIGVAMEQIQLNKADMAVAGAGENECWQFTAMFDCMGALSTKRNAEPTKLGELNSGKASRAFDKERDGFVIAGAGAGGGGMVVLEELEHAKARGARIYGELVGYAANSDGYDVVAPSGVGGEKCHSVGKKCELRFDAPRRAFGDASRSDESDEEQRKESLQSRDAWLEPAQPLKVRVLEGLGERDFGDEDRKLNEWFEEKKAEGTAAAGGAVLGGMLGGPIGAVVGSQARQRAEELGGCELAAWEGIVAAGMFQYGFSRLTDKTRSLSEVASKIGPVLNNALDAMEVDEGDEEKEEVSKKEAKETKDVQATAATPKPAAPPKPKPKADELQQIREKLKVKQKTLEKEIDDLYHQAEEALKAGEEDRARECLEERAKRQKSLKDMTEGQERRAEQRKKKAEEIYHKVAHLHSRVTMQQKGVFSGRMKLALAMADQIGGEKEVTYVNTHGTSTPIGDVQELGAVKRVFEERGYQPYVGSTKSMSGHALGAAGVHEAIYSLLMMDRGFLAESINIENLVDEAEGMKILTERHDGEVARVASNSFGFGGTNACLVFDKYEAHRGHQT